MRRPQGPFSEHAPNATDLVSLASEAENDAAFETLLELLPISSMQRHVDEFFARNLKAASAGASGDVVAELAHELPRDLGLKLMELVHRPKAARLDIQTESESARRALVAYWLSAVDHAFRELSSGGTDAALALTTALLPPRPSEHSALARWENWDARRRRSLDSVLSSVCLTSDGLGDATLTFCRNVNVAVVKRGELFIPPNYLLRPTRVGYRLSRR